MVTISLSLLCLGVISGLITIAVWALKKAHGLTPSDIV